MKELRQLSPDNAKVVFWHNQSQLDTDPFHNDPAEAAALNQSLVRCFSEFVDAPNFFKGKTVFIKPNLNFLTSHINPYSMTDPRMLCALSSLLDSYEPKKIIIGEKPGNRTSSQSYDLVKQNFTFPTSIEFLELDNVERVSAKTKTGQITNELLLPKKYLEADVIIDLPKMKTHTLTTVSLGIKNLFGLLTDDEKIRHHNENIAQKLTDLLSVRQPDFVIIDGLYGMEGQGPLFGTPINSNIIVMSNNCVAGDAAAANFMGFEPRRIAHINLCDQNNLGPINAPTFHINQDNSEKQKIVFKEGNAFNNPIKNISIHFGKNVSIGDLNALSHTLERIDAEKMTVPDFSIYVGEFNNIQPGKADILFGNSCINSVSPETQSAKIDGSPPRAFVLYDYLQRLGK